jgi:hypothetical protein
MLEKTVRGNQEGTIQKTGNIGSALDIGRRTKNNNTTQKTKKMSNTDPTKNEGEPW